MMNDDIRVKCRDGRPLSAAAARRRGAVTASMANSAQHHSPVIPDFRMLPP